MKPIRETLTYIILFIWQLPQNIVAVAWMLVLRIAAGFGTKKSGERALAPIHYENYCLCLSASKMRGGVSLGSFIILSPQCAASEWVVRHEYGHVKDSHRMGPLYLFIIGIPSLVWCMVIDVDARHPERPQRDYYSFYTEKRANKNSGLA